MRNGIGITDIDGSVGEDGAEERSDDALGLVRASNVAVTDVENNQRVNLRRQGRRRRRRELQNCAIANRHVRNRSFDSEALLLH